MTELTNLILSSLSEINDDPVNKEIFKSDKLKLSNEFLLILKPEVFANTKREEQCEILDYLQLSFSRFNFQIDNVRVFNASYLGKYNVIAKHYGVINAVARDSKKYLSEEAKAKFGDIYDVSFDEANCYGSLELLNDNKLTETELSDLWKEVKIERLAGGMYAGKTSYNGEELYIVNGFHPPQLKHFIDTGRITATMNVSSNTSWEIARSEMIGNTYPEKASKDSIRGYLFKRFGKYGFDDVSYVLNSVHLSAGPLEGLIELQRFNSAFEKEEKAPVGDFVFGKLLKESFSQEQVDWILTNPIVKNNGKSISLFDLTEELDSADALEVLKKSILSIH